MNLRLVRELTKDKATAGVLFIDDAFFSFTLEDELREVAGQPVSEWKVKSLTAIPAGRYRVKITFSNRFQRLLPELLDVPGFTGIRIHSGNTSVDTEGCLLVGLARSNATVLQSRPAIVALQEQIEKAIARGEEVWIDIENPPSYQAA